MSGYAMRALVLLYVDRNVGMWVPLDWMQTRVTCSPESLRLAATELAEVGMVKRQVVDGRAMYGRDVTAASEVVA